jgi:hypothetical protein
MRRLLLAACGLLLSFTAQAQTATITGTIVDLTLTPVTSGKVTFTLMPGIDTTISGTARFSRTAVTCGINGSGLIKNALLSGACVVTKNTSLSPSGTYYNVCLYPVNVKTQCFNTYIYGDLDISTPVPTPTTAPAYSFVDKISNQADIAGNKTFTGIVSFSLPIIPLAGIDGEIYLSAYSGDWCYRITQAEAALPSGGGTINANGLTGTQTCATSVTITKPTKLKVGHASVTGSVNPMFRLAADFMIEGAGYDSVLTSASGGMIFLARGPAKHFEAKSVRFVGNGADSRGIQFAAYQEQIDQIANNGIVRTSNVVTVTFGERCSLEAGDAVTTESVTDTSFNGTFTVLTSCESSASHNQITYAQTAANASSGLGDVRITGSHGWDRAQISIDKAWWTNFGNWAVWFGQSAYMDYISNSTFQDNNGSVWQEYASDLFIKNSLFEFTNSTAHTNPHVSLKNGSKATVSHSEFLNNGANLTAAGIPDIQVEAANLGGNSGWITIGPGNKFGPEGETTSRPKIRISSTRNYGNSSANVFNVRVIDNDFGGANPVSPKELAAIYIANPVYNMTVDLNHFSVFQYAINDTQTLTSSENAGNSIFGEGNQFYTGLASFGSDMRQNICVNGCRQFSEVKGKLYAGDDYRALNNPFPRWTETEKLQNRLLQSADMTNTTNWTPHSVSKSISAISRAANVVTFTCATACYPSVGYNVLISGVPVGANTFNGTFSVASRISSTQGTYAQVGANESQSSGTAQVYDTKVTGGQTDPLGGTNAFLIDTAANGGDSANIHSNVSDNTSRTTRLVDKVWMKSGTCTQVGFGIFDLTTSAIVVNQTYTITSTWKQYKVIGNGLSLTDQYEIIWYPHALFDTTNNGCNLSLYAPQQADDDSDYVPTTTAAYSSTLYGSDFSRAVDFQQGILIGTKSSADTNSSRIKAHLSTTSTIDFANTLAQTCTDSSGITLTGAASGDSVALGVTATPASTTGLTYFAYVSASDTVKVRVCNVTVGAIDPASGTFRIDVWQH